VSGDRGLATPAEVIETLQAVVAATALALARPALGAILLDGAGRRRPFRLHAEGKRVILTNKGQERRQGSCRRRG
jgi:hypothetical protein